MSKPAHTPFRLVDPTRRAYLFLVACGLVVPSLCQAVPNACNRMTFSYLNFVIARLAEVCALCFSSVHLTALIQIQRPLERRYKLYGSSKLPAYLLERMSENPAPPEILCPNVIEPSYLRHQDKAVLLGEPRDSRHESKISFFPKNAIS